MDYLYIIARQGFARRMSHIRVTADTCQFGGDALDRHYEIDRPRGDSAHRH